MNQSLERGLEILKYLSTHTNARVTEIAEVFRINKSTASRILATLVEQGVAVRNGKNKTYRVGVGVLQFGHQILNEARILDVFHPVMQEVMTASKETVHLCTISNGMVYILDQLRSEHNRFLNELVISGVSLPFHCTASGKIHLACQPENVCRQMLQSAPLTKHTDKTITDAAALMEHLAVVRQRGYALDEEEMSKGVYCMAIPLMGVRGDARYSLGLTGSHPFASDPERLHRNLTILRNAEKTLRNRFQQLT